MATTILLDTFTAPDGTDPTTRPMDVSPAITGLSNWRTPTPPPELQGEILGNRLVPPLVDYSSGEGSVFLFGYGDANEVFVDELPYFLLLAGDVGSTVNGWITATLYSDGVDSLEVFWSGDGTAYADANSASEYWQSANFFPGSGTHTLGLYVAADGSVSLIVDGTVRETSGLIGMVPVMNFVRCVIAPFTGDVHGSKNVDRIALYKNLTLSEAAALTGAPPAPPPPAPPPPPPSPGLTMFPPVFQTLKASVAVKAIVGTNPPRIYRHGNAPQDASRPYVTWFVVFGDPENNLSDLPPVDRVTVQVDVWHQTDSGVELLALAVRDAIEPHAHMTGVPIDLREPETKLYRIALTFDWFVDREETT